MTFLATSFTFHHVSIKTSISVTVPPFFIHSHSTMYLLKRDGEKQSAVIYRQFTFHHVSIKTHGER